MLEVDAAMGTLTVPIWAAGAASAIVLVLLVLAIGRVGAATMISSLFRVALVVFAVSAGWFYMQRTEQEEHATARRLFDEHSAALLARAVAPGSALSCLDELAGETVEVACEKSLFASPEAVSAAVSYITAKLALLVDGSNQARVEPALGSELAPLLTALELDRFGIVAHVLTTRYGCTAEKCDALAWFRDSSRVQANLRDHTFDEQVTKFAAVWNRATRADGAADLPHTGSTPAMVSSHYDPPSSQSIPPINIMVPETSAARNATPSNGPSNAQSSVPPGDGNPRPAATPVPPRRPPQGRPPAAAAASRPNGQQPAPPVANGDTSTDGAVTRPSGSALSQ